MSKTFQFGNGEWAVGKETALAYNDENSNFKPLPFTFDRASTATVVNKDGLIETVGTDEPRIDFLNNTNGHLLLEPSRTNLVTYSEDFSEWTNDRVTVSENQIISPNGTLNADLIAENSENSIHRIYIGSITLTDNVDYTITVFAKKGNSKVIQLTPTSTSAIGSGRANFDLDNGVLGDVSGGTAEIKDYGNGWYRCSYSFEALATASSAIAINLVNDNLNASRNITYTGNTNNNVYLWGAMFEQGSYATSYIPTSGQSGGVTRSAETCNNAGNSNVFNDSEGVLYVETEQFTDGDFQSTYISLNQDGSSTNHLTIQHRNSGQLRIYANGFGTAEIQFLENIDMAQNLKIAVQYKQNDYKLFVNGTQYSIYPSGGSQPALTGLNVVEFHLPTSVSQFWLGKVKDLKVYNTALSDSELQALTS